MSHLAEAKTTRQTYENLYAKCPSCGHENIFNRASDLNDLEPIDSVKVSCSLPDCSKPFRLYGDVVNPAFEMLIFDCHELMGEKHYAYCILNLAQAYEVFFSQYLRVELLYRPVASEFDRGNHDIDHLNRLRKLLYESVKELTFSPLRNLFVNTVLRRRCPSSLAEAENSIKEFSKNLSKPSEEWIRNGNTITDRQLVGLLLGLMSCKTAKLRNDVVHKLAYRPTLEQVNDCLKETREILFGLAGRLGARYDDIAPYRAKRQQSSRTSADTGA